MDEMDVANDKTDMTVDKAELEIPIDMPVNCKQVSYQNAYINISILTV